MCAVPLPGPSTHQRWLMSCSKVHLNMWPHPWKQVLIISSVTLVQVLRLLFNRHDQLKFQVNQAPRNTHNQDHPIWPSKQNFYKTPEWIAQKSYGCTIPGSVQNQVRQGLEQPRSSGRCPCPSQGSSNQGVFKVPFQPKPFYDFLILRFTVLHCPHSSFLDCWHTAFAFLHSYSHSCAGPTPTQKYCTCKTYAMVTESFNKQ